MTRLADLDQVLNSADTWISKFLDIPVPTIAGITVDAFSQFMHALVILFRLSTLQEPGWDTDMVLSRANVLNILDKMTESIDRLPSVLDIVDTQGSRAGIFSKTSYLLRAIKTLFQKELGQGSSLGDQSSQEFDIDTTDFFVGLENEPWFWDVLGPMWNGQTDD